jgi:hypothetical protein
MTPKEKEKEKERTEAFTSLQQRYQSSIANGASTPPCATYHKTTANLKV